MIGREEYQMVLRVTTLLDEIGIPYLIGGLVASALFGEPRGTRDVDLVVELEHSGIERLAKALEPDFYVSREAMREAVRDRRSFNAIELDGGMKVDCFVRGYSEFDREEFARRRREALVAGDSARLWVKTPEDSVIRKLLWYRAGQGALDQQWRDVLGLLSMRAGRLDEEYLTSWAARLELSELLGRARDESSR